MHCDVADCDTLLCASVVIYVWTLYSAVTEDDIWNISMGHGSQSKPRLWSHGSVCNPCVCTWFDIFPGLSCDSMSSVYQHHQFSKALQATHCLEIVKWSVAGLFLLVRFFLAALLIKRPPVAVLSNINVCMWSAKKVCWGTLGLLFWGQTSPAKWQVP